MFLTGFVRYTLAWFNRSEILWALFYMCVPCWHFYFILTCATGTKLTLCFVPLFLIVRHSKNKSRITHFITFSPHGHFSMHFSFILLKIENAWRWGQAVRVCAPAVHLLLISQLKRRSYQKEEKNNHSGFKLTKSSFSLRSTLLVSAALAAVSLRVKAEPALIPFATFAHFMPSLVCCVLFTFHWKLSLHYHGAVCLLNQLLTCVIVASNVHFSRENARVYGNLKIVSQRWSWSFVHSFVKTTKKKNRKEISI